MTTKQKEHTCLPVDAPWVAIRDLYYPGLRRVRPYGITLNTSVRRVYSCVCGCEISYCTRWPMTQRVKEWMVAHSDCQWEGVSR